MAMGHRQLRNQSVVGPATKLWWSEVALWVKGAVIRSQLAQRRDDGNLGIPALTFISNGIIGL